jgi:hypothetical protein
MGGQGGLSDVCDEWSSAPMNGQDGLMKPVYE